MKRRILITGAAGNIGSKLIRSLKQKHDLILMDRRRLNRQNFFHADFRHYDPNWVKYFGKVSTVLHLAANPDEKANWEHLIPENIDSVLNVCHACIEKKVNRLIFASSCHTMGGYRKRDVDYITADMEPLPDCDYGVSKLIGERICKSFSDRFPLSVICLRIGWVPREEDIPSIKKNSWLRILWLSTRDLIQVFEKSIEAKDIKFKILYAMSQNKGMNWDLYTTMKTLNYAPQDGLS